LEKGFLKTREFDSPEFDLSPTPLLRGEGLKTLMFSCPSISFQEREVGRERFIELTLKS
jgi:hypothetical protein